MKKIAIVYHSGYGHTEAVAEQVAEGVRQVSGVEVQLYKALDITDTPEVLNDADAMIFGSPTYMGSAAAELKKFMEVSSKLWYTREWENKLAAGFTNSHSLSGDKLNTLLQMGIFAAQHGMIWVGQGEMNGSPDGEPGKASVVNRMGSSFGLMTQAENDAPEVTPPEGDRETARLFGKRIADVLTKRFV